MLTASLLLLVGTWCLALGRLCVSMRATSPAGVQIHVLERPAELNAA
jgi:hypothetical protein